MSEITQITSCFLPNLTAGKYTVGVTQTVKHNNAIVQNLNNRLQFAVDAARFAINPDDIYSVYPPSGTNGDYQHHFPHVVFNRKTLPWERTIDGKATGYDPNHPESFIPKPWMALILLDSEEMKELIIKPSELRQVVEDKTDNDIIQRPKILSDTNSQSLSLMEWENLDQKCFTIDLPKALFVSHVPSLTDLPYLAHSKRVNITHKDKNGINDISENEAFFSVLIGNRIIEANKNYTALVVSLEGQQDYIENNSMIKDKLRMVVLANWNFSCEGTTSFNTLVSSLEVKEWRISNIPTLKNDLSNALKHGYLPLTHNFRNGTKSISWFRGPFIPTEKHFDVSEFITYSSSDAALYYDNATGLLDVSLASAFELGKILALKNKEFTKGMVAWNNQPFLEKTQESNLVLSKDQLIALIEQKQLPKLPEVQNNTLDSYRDFPDVVNDFLSELAKLKGVPLSYLISDKRYLQSALGSENTISLFHIDSNWIFALLNGAVSIGKLRDWDVKTQLTKLIQAIYGINFCSGFLLHSPLVSGWRGIEIKTFNKKGTLIENPVRFERITPELFLGIYTDSIYKIQLKQPYEGMHFGLKKTNGMLTLAVKNESGEMQVDKKVPISMDSGLLKQKQVLNPSVLSKNLKFNTSHKRITSAEYAFQLIDSPTEATYTINFTAE